MITLSEIKQQQTNPTPSKDVYENIRNIMKEGRISGEIDVCPDGTITILIEWGDWKHEHGCLKYLMNKAGYIQTKEEITEEDGSDCYSARHTYLSLATFIKRKTEIFRNSMTDYQTTRV